MNNFFFLVSDVDGKQLQLKV